jgi:hypothetical protein
MGGMDPVIGSLAVAVMIAFMGNMLVISIPVQQQQPVANQVR